MTDQKPELPYGWVVKQSKSYPDRVYYFNVNTGASTWDFPDLLQPLLQGQSAQQVPHTILSPTSLNSREISSPTKPVPNDWKARVSHGTLSKGPVSTKTVPKSKTSRESKITCTGDAAGFFSKEAEFSPELSDGETDSPNEFASNSVRHQKQSLRTANIHGKPSAANPGASQKVQAFGKMEGYKKYRTEAQQKANSNRPGVRDTIFSPSEQQKASSNKPGVRDKIVSPSGQQKANSHRPGVRDKIGSPSGQQKANSNRPGVRDRIFSPSEQQKANGNRPGVRDRIFSPSEQQKANGNRPGVRDRIFSPSEQQKANGNRPGVRDKIFSPSELQKANGNRPGVRDRIFSPSEQQKANSNRPGDGDKIVSPSRQSKSSLIQQHGSGSQSSKQQNENQHPLGSGSSHSAGQDKDCKNTKSRKVKVISRDFPQGLLSQNSDSKLPHSKSPVRKRKISPVRSPEAPNKLMRSELPSRRVVCNKSAISATETSGHGLDSDTRKVVKSLQLQQAGQRSIKVKADPVSNIKLLLKGKKETQLGNDLVVSTSCTGVAEDKRLSPSGRSHLCSRDSDGEDGNNNTKLKLYIGDKDKLLTIQSWIDNLQEGSDSPAQEFYAQTRKGEADLLSMNRSTDSGYASVVSPKVRTERGWPGELKPSSVDDREIVAMEVDTWDLPEDAGPTDLEEAMDIDLVLIEVRQEVKANPKQVTCDIQFTDESVIQQGLLIAVDTNVLISNLKFLEDLRDLEVKGFGKPVLYIPWIVLQELDRLKEKFSSKMPSTSIATQTKARQAISFLRNQFTNKHPRVVGQSPKEAKVAAQEFSACCNDDAILQACLHCQKQYPASRVVLLTNDINLINKAIVSNVKAFSSTEIIEGLKSLPPPKCSLPQPSNTLVLSTCDSPALANQSSSHLGSPLPPPSVPYTSTAHYSQQSAIHTPQKTNSLTGQSVISISGNQCEKKHLNVASSLTKKSNSGDPVKKIDCIPSPNINQTGCMTEGLLEEEKHYTEATLVDDIYCKLKTVLKEALGKVLEVEMKKAYDDIWLEIVYRKPPWTLRDILECWKKHWMAVFGLVFNRNLENNILSLRERFFNNKGPTLPDMLQICADCLPILHECASKQTYGETMVDIKMCVQAVCDLCRSVTNGQTTVQSVSSLDSYLKSKLLSQKNAKSSDITPDSIPAHHTTSTCSPPHKSVHQSMSVLTDTQTFSKTGVKTKSKTVEPVSNTPSNMNCADNVISPSNSLAPSLPPEVAAGELLQHIWQFIYKYCDHIYKALTGTMSAEVKQKVESVLHRLVPAAKELRVLYTGLLEVPCHELTKHKDKFVALSNHCMAFFSFLDATESSPDVPVTPTQFLMLFASPQHRQTLDQFQSQLDDMLRHLYGCLNILYPDD